MRYAIRINRLPPCVIYLESIQPVVSILQLINLPMFVGKPFKLAESLSYQFDGWCEIVEDENSLVFTDTRGADYLLIREGDKFVATKC